MGGSHLSTLLLAQGLAGQGIHVQVVVHEDGPLVALLTDRGVPFELAPAPAVRSAGTRSGYLRAVARSTPMLRRFLLDRGTTVVHTNDLRSHRAWMLAAKAARVPHVWHQRTRFYAPRIGRIQLRVPDRIISISRYVDSTMPPFARRKSTVVANPFDTVVPPPDREAARRSLLAEIGASMDDRVVGFVGNLTEQKRPLVFVETAARVADQEPRAQFVLFGRDRSGNAARVADRSRELEIGQRVHHLGFRSPIEPPLAGCDVLVAPGVHEGFGRTVVEAMLVGTPVVAARSGGHPEAVEDGRTGFLVPPDDPAATAAAVARLLADHQVASALASAARATARLRYSVHRHVQDVLGVYMRLR